MDGSKSLRMFAISIQQALPLSPYELFRNVQEYVCCGYGMVRNVFRNVKTKAKCGGYMGTTTEHARYVFQECAG